MASELERIAQDWRRNLEEAQSIAARLRRFVEAPAARAGACGALIAGSQNSCTRDRAHPGEHRCSAADVDARARTGASNG